jgi:hypothetical protein
MEASEASVQAQLTNEGLLPDSDSENGFHE